MIETGKTIFGGTSATTNYIKTLASPQKSWEIIDVRNIGLDMNLLRNRLQFTGEYYWKRNINMLSSAMGVPSLIGIGLPSANVGELSGVGRSTCWRDKIGKHFSYWVGPIFRTARTNWSNTKEATSFRKASFLCSKAIRSIRYGATARRDSIRKPRLWRRLSCSPAARSLRRAMCVMSTGTAIPTLRVAISRPIRRAIWSCSARPIRVIRSVPIWDSNGKGCASLCSCRGVGKRNFLLDEATLNPTQGSLYQAINIHRDYWTP